MTETECAARIRAYWLTRGYEVKVHIISDTGAGPCTRSDMLNGLPRGYRDVNGTNLGVAAA